MFGRELEQEDDLEREMQEAVGRASSRSKEASFDANALGPHHTRSVAMCRARRDGLRMVVGPRGDLACLGVKSIDAARKCSRVGGQGRVVKTGQLAS